MSAEDIDIAAELIEGWDILETVCCICDDGGDVICCDGVCLRSFHLSKGDSECPSLGLSKAKADLMDKFHCPNCKLKIHQCFVCRQLGRSDATAPEVFMCNVPMCGLFYHPSCVAKLILMVKDTSDEYIALVESIKQRDWFECPRHKCRKCGGGEEEENVEKQLGMCRRCPRSWHRQCLPHSVLHPKDNEPQRAWDGLLPNRILIYCERHTIIPKLGTPARNHVKFPEALLPSLQKRLVKRKADEEQQKRKLIKLDEACVKSLAGEKTAKLLKSNIEKKVKPFLSIGQQTKTEDRGLTKSKLDRANLVITKVNKQAPAVFLIKGRNNVGPSARQEWPSKEDGRKVSKPHELSLLSKCTSVSHAKLERTSSMVSKPRDSGSHQLQQKGKPLEIKQIKVDSATRSMVKGIIERAKSSITIESVKEKHVVPAGYEPIPVNLDKTYTVIKIESIVKGMRKALETLENGGSIEDARVKCSPEFIKFMEMCNRHLRVYLCPFLHGSRYTSYGRHFTQPRKLIEIVERLHWYVDNGDMVVDFCCGSNDFSLLMKQKMEETGKKCAYKNFDLIQTKHDFNFFKGNWFDVKQDQFPNGNRLIMGLNPPFALANRFINHALKFKPKLIVLIVPKETERLDQKRDMYDLIWEDDDLLAGKSFYLPGSLDEDDNTMDDWNIVTSPVYVWSKPNWTLKHKQIALERGHISLNSSCRFVGSPCSETSLRLPSPSDFEIEKDNNYAPPMEHGGWEGRDSDKNKNSMSLVELHEPKDGQDTGPTKESCDSFKLKEQNKRNIELLECNMDGVEPVIVNECTDKQETAPIQDWSDSFKLEDLYKRSRDLLECRNGEKFDVASSSKFDTQVKDMSPKSSMVKDTSHKEQSIIEHPKDFLTQSQPEKGVLEASTKASADKPAKKELAQGKAPTKAAEEISVIATMAKRDEPAKVKSLERHSHICAKEMENARLNSQKPPERATGSCGPRDDVLEKQRNSNDVLQADENDQQAKEHMHNLKADIGEGEAPSKKNRYEAGTRKLPDNCNGHGEEAERSLRGAFATEHRKEMLDKSCHEILSSSSTTKINGLREFGVNAARGGTDEGCHDSMSHRVGSPNSRHMPEDTKRTWVTPGGYEGAAGNHARTNDYSKTESWNSELLRSASRYDNVAYVGSKNLETQGNFPGKGLYGQGAPCVRDQGPLHMHMYGGSGDTALATQYRSTGFDHSVAPRGMHGMRAMNYVGSGYGMPFQTEGLLRTSAISETSFSHPHQNCGRGWQGNARPPMRPPIYGSFQPQQRPPLGLHIHSQFSGHNPLHSGPACPQTSVPHYAPMQERLSSQANVHASGGWFEE